jgi:hypothetical protein
VRMLQHYKLNQLLFQTDPPPDEVAKNLKSPEGEQ